MPEDKTTTILPVSEVDDSYLLLAVRLPAPGKTVKDKATTEQVNQDNSAEADAAEVRKNLFTQNIPGLKAAQDSLKALLHTWALPSMFPGVYVLEPASYAKFIPLMDSIIERYNKVVREELYANYDNLIERERKRHGSNFNLGDYIPKEEILKRFKPSVKVIKMSEATTSGLSTLAKEHVDRIKRDHTTAMQSFEQAQKQKFIGMVREALRRASNLTEKRPQIKRTMDYLEGVADFLDTVLPSLRMGNDPVIQNISTQIREKILNRRNLIQDSVRDRTAVAVDADEISATLDGLERTIWGTQDE